MADKLAGTVKTTFEVNLDIPNIQIEHVETDFAHPSVRF